jgi:hypothetical protein
MRILRRHFFIALLPLILGLAASWGFAFSQDKCGRLVGPIFAPKCHWIQLEYQLGFQMAGTLLGRHRRRRLAGTAQPARGGTCPQPGSDCMKRLLAFALLATTIAPLAAQDSTAAAPAAPAANVSVEAVLARTLVDRAPQDTGSAFPDSVGTVVLWMRVTGANGQTLHHVWFHGDDQVGDVPLTVGGSPWRTWSRKTIPADAKGAWHVEIKDDAGNVLKRIDFTVGQ